MANSGNLAFARNKSAAASLSTVVVELTNNVPEKEMRDEP
jgi:hypothetical protein